MSAKRSRPGSILMEFILVAPLMLLLISMVLQFAHIWTARQVTAYAAYCATRAIMAVPPNEQKNAAQKAAEVACSWMALAGLPNAAKAGGSTTKSVYVGKLHNVADVSDSVDVAEGGTPVLDETLIPGWGSIPGSDSVSKRVSVEIVRSGTGALRNGTGEPFAEVTVHFKFPLVLPLAGRMISLFANNDNPNRAQDGSYGDPERRRGSRWYGEDIGDETVMDENGNAVNRKGARWGEDGQFPIITLTETCILPMPYSTANFPAGGYATDRLKVGGAL